MRRRHLLGLSATGFVGICSGCSGASGAPGVDGSDATVVPTDETVLEIEASTVGSLRFSSLPDADGITIDTNSVDLSPSPSGQDDADPPYWNWSRTRSTVAVEVPVRVSGSIEPGEYPYEVTVWDDRHYTDDVQSTTEEFVITVEED